MNVYFFTVVLVALFSYTAQKFHVWATIYDISCAKQVSQIRTYRFFVVLTSIVLIFVSGFRYMVGTDYWQYSLNFSVYSDINNLWTSLWSFDGEPGIRVISVIASWIYNDYATMFVLAALVTVTLNVIPISKYSENFFFGMILYVLIGAWSVSFNAVRQCLAGAVLFCGHRYMFERKFWKYFLVVLVAMQFHVSALIMLPVYVVANKRNDWKSIAIIVVGAVVMRYSYDFLFSAMGVNGEIAYMQRDVNILRVLVAFAPLVLICLTPKSFRDQPENAFYNKMLFVNAAFILATSGSAYLARVNIYTKIYAVLAFPRLFKAFKPRDRYIIAGIILILYGVFWWYELSISTNTSNFRWIFER